MRLLWFQTLILAVTGWGRAYTVITDWSRFQELVDHLPAPLYVAISVLWGSLFAALTIGIWRRKKWAIQWLWPILAGYAIFAIVWQQLFALAPGERERLPFLVGAYIGLLIMNWILIRRRQMRVAFQK